MCRFPVAQLVLTVEAEFSFMASCWFCCASAKLCKIVWQSSSTLSSVLLRRLNGASSLYLELKALNLIRCGKPREGKLSKNNATFFKI